MKSFWDKIAPLYDITEAINGKVYAAMLGYSRDLVPDGARVLECAAGTGEISIAVANKAKEIVCTDLSMEMLSTAEKKCRRKGISNISFDQRDIFNLADEDESYDVVIAANVLHLIENPRKAVEELTRVLKSGGKLLVPTFVTNHDNHKPLFLIKLYRLFGYNSTSEFTFDTYMEMLKGCKVKGRIKMRQIKGLIPLAYGVIEKA